MERICVRKKSKRSSTAGQHDKQSPTIINTIRTIHKGRRTLPEGIRRYSKEMDATLPGRHTRTLYNNLKRREASVLAQLRTGIARFNGHRLMPADKQQKPSSIFFSDVIPNTNASADGYKKRQSLLSLGRKSTV